MDLGCLQALASSSLLMELICLNCKAYPILGLLKGAVGTPNSAGMTSKSK